MNEKESVFDFPNQTVNDWMEAARQELDGLDPFEKLAIDIDGIAIKPYYDVAERSKIKAAFSLSSQLTESSTPRYWHNMPKVVVADAKEANKAALIHLNAGADGVLFDLKENGIKADVLLNEIELPYCCINFQLNSHSDSFLPLFHAFAEKKFDTAIIPGNFFFRDVSHSPLSTIDLFKSWTNFKYAGIIAPQKDNAADEIAYALSTACGYIDQHISHGEHIIHNIALQVSCGNNFFLQIAKFKVLRMLWQTMISAYGVTSSHKPLFLHVILKPYTQKEYQPNGNMIQQTTAALSAILGGCDALTVEPEDDTNSNMTRIARNISTILREESHIAKVADPTAGSYYIESLTDQLAQKAWHTFQAIVK